MKGNYLDIHGNQSQKQTNRIDKEEQWSQSIETEVCGRLGNTLIAT